MNCLGWLLLVYNIGNTVHGRTPKQPPDMYETLDEQWDIYHILPYQQVIAGFFSINRIMTRIFLLVFFCQQDLHRPVATDLATLDSPGEMTQNGGSPICRFWLI